MSILLSIIAGLNANQTKIEAKGEDSHVISSYAEARSFSLAQNLIRKYFAGVYSGAEPAGTYIRDYSPWNGYGNPWNLYKTYGWKEVTIRTKNVKIQTINKDVGLSIIVSELFRNNTNRPQKHTPKASRGIENMISIKWTKEKTFATSLEVGLNVVFSKGPQVSSSFGFTETLKFGEEKGNSVTEKYSLESGGIIDVPAKTCTLVTMYGNQAKLKAKIEYEASLSGAMAVNYDSPYKGHYFWQYDIREVLKAVNLPSTQTMEQEIELGYIFNTEIKVEDVDCNNPNKVLRKR